MFSFWKGNLCNTATDVLIDTTLLVLVICAYIPQITRLRKDTSTRGILAYYNLFNMFFCNAQLSESLLCAAYAWPTNSSPVIVQINDGSLKGLRAFGGILGLLQIFIHWSCSVAVLTSSAVRSKTSGLRGRSISIMAFLHAAVVLFPAAAIALPKPSAHSWGTDISMVLILMSNIVVVPCFVVLQFYAQYREMRTQNGNPGALSLLSICLQVPVIAMLGFRWLLRLGNPTWDSTPDPIWLWYEWGVPAINDALHAMGCVFLLACYFSAARETDEYGDSDDRVPLLR